VTTSGTSDSRNNALWGRGGRGAKTLGVIAAVAVLAFACADVKMAEGAKPTPRPSGDFVPSGLLKKANANPGQKYDVLVTLMKGAKHGSVSASGVTRSFHSLNTFEANLPGGALAALAKNPNVLSIVPNYTVKARDFSNSQIWPDAAQVSQAWPSFANGAPTPTVAVIDSGVDANHPDLAGQVIASTAFVSDGNYTPNGDGDGHGTFVAGTLAGSAPGYAGAAPGTKIVSVDVLDNTGAGTLGDVIQGVQWVLDHAAQYNIRVVNMSLNAGTASSFQWDPLDQAVEQLWFHGIVVVVAAGNYGTDSSTPSGVLYAPANDPFVITVGAADTNGTVDPSDDFAAPWSAWGHTEDGFAKPDLAAPGRVMNGPVPDGAYLPTQLPDRVVAPGYMWLSGTSMATPVVSAAAADLLASNPTWTPDQVKGALMASVAQPAGYTSFGPLGFGVLQAGLAALQPGTVNPNAALDQFVSSDPSSGQSVFDAASWDSAASANASWDSASWDSASWDSASWDSASWDSASWDSASWDSASWDSASWDSASWDTSSSVR